MRPADFELLVCRTAGLSPAAVPAGLIEKTVRKRAADLGCRTLYAYGVHLETSESELAALIADVMAGCADAPSPAAPPRPRPPTSLALARLDPRFRRRQAARNVVPLRAPPAVTRTPATPENDTLAEARRTVLRALDGRAPSARALVLLGLIREADGAPDDAMNCYRLALRTDPGSDDARRALVALAARTALAEGAVQPQRSA